jgi:uncharacterized membrane protein
MNYLSNAFVAWFTGFFPLAEIYVAVPAAMATGLDIPSVIFWSVLGNYTPVLLIHFLYERLNKIERVRRWLASMVSEKATDTINRYGTPIVLLITPWVGVWIMAVTAKVMGMRSSIFLPTALVSITAYATVLALLIQAGINVI